MSDKDSIDRELESGRTNAEVDTELETLKTEMGKSSAPAESDDEASSADVDVDEELEEMDVADEDVEAELEELKNEDDA
jgi:phage shock protein A